MGHVEELVAAVESDNQAEEYRRLRLFVGAASALQGMLASVGPGHYSSDQLCKMAWEYAHALDKAAPWGGA